MGQTPLALDSKRAAREKQNQTGQQVSVFGYEFCFRCLTHVGRIKAIQRYPDLKHFPNGITDLEYITGKEHGVILRMIIPSLAEIYIQAKYTTHNDITLERLDKEIERFDELHRELAQTFDGVHGNYPKYHSLSHLTAIIRRHSTTDNYHTGLGEAMHPQSKKDYRRTNQQPNFEIQMLRMYQEREAIMRIRACVDAAAKHGNEDESDSADPWEGPRVQLGSSDRNGRQLATTFIQQHVQSDPDAQKMERNLRTFLYQQVGGFGNRIHFRESDLPTLKGMLVSVYRLVSVGYVSLLDSRSTLDIARATDSWRNQGPRYDHAIVDDGNERFVARLIKLFTLRARDKQHSIAYVRLFKIGRRNKKTRFIELSDTKIQTFIFAACIVRSCVVISPRSRKSKHLLWDLEGPDMYLRLQEL
ncbi:hypothetical protein FS749_011472 [Ceratobasidium sp. UAMH 11750]|nr:hypothetical protein FS749_011472 [Ceratobasidium sp. UAMH 11750]